MIKDLGTGTTNSSRFNQLVVSGTPLAKDLSKSLASISNSLDERVSRINGGELPSSDLDMGSHRILNLGDLKGAPGKDSILDRYNYFKDNISEDKLNERIPGYGDILDMENIYKENKELTSKLKPIEGDFRLTPESVISTTIRAFNPDFTIKPAKIKPLYNDDPEGLRGQEVKEESSAGAISYAAKSTNFEVDWGEDEVRIIEVDVVDVPYTTYPSSDGNIEAYNVLTFCFADPWDLYATQLYYYQEVVIAVPNDVINTKASWGIAKDRIFFQDATEILDEGSESGKYSDIVPKLNQAKRFVCLRGDGTLFILDEDGLVKASALLPRNNLAYCVVLTSSTQFPNPGQPGKYNYNYDGSTMQYSFLSPFPFGGSVTKINDIQGNPALISFDN